MNFFEKFISDIVDIGNEFVSRFKNIPSEWADVKKYLPTALTGFVVVLSMLAIIAVVILAFSKIMASANKKKAVASATEKNSVALTSSGTPLPENTSAGSLETVDVDEKTAAVIMAIVSKESGIPLNRLSFKSIRLIED